MGKKGGRVAQRHGVAVKGANEADDLFVCQMTSSSVSCANGCSPNRLHFGGRASTACRLTTKSCEPKIAKVFFQDERQREALPILAVAP